MKLFRIPAVLGLSLALCSALLPTARAAEPQAEFPENSHIVVVGNATADRMQWDGWLETLLQQAYPGKNLVYRDLGFSGDQLSSQPRQQNYPSNEQFLAHLKADVIFCFFGYNESFAGQAGLEKFKSDYKALIQKYRESNFNGKGTLSIVLFSPIAHENLGDPSLPDGAANNKRLELYTQAIKEVAESEKTGFVDLFHPTLQAYESTDNPLTINGIHQTTEGGRRIADFAAQALTGQKLSLAPACAGH